MPSAILQTLLARSGQFVPASELHQHAPDAARAITQLRQFGYDIESHPHWGYRLCGVPDRLSAEDLRARLETVPSTRRTIGREILVFDETGSTNDVVARLAHDGAREGLVVFAESQTRGRGRHGRVWASPRGKGLWCSVLLRPRFPATRITVAASVAVARAIGLNARIKWPNDVTLGGKKVAGILTETRDRAAVLGIGLNVNCDRTEIPDTATSLFLETGQRHDRAALGAAMLTQLDRYYRLAAADFAQVTSEWARWCTTLGRQIVVRMGERRIEGHAQALDGDGALLVRRDNGQVERILGAELTVEQA